MSYYYKIDGFDTYKRLRNYGTPINEQGHYQLRLDAHVFTDPIPGVHC